MKINISAKCSDLFWYEIIDDNGNTVSEKDGYVPSFMPGEHYGDYVMLEIDPKTGQILNWDKNLVFFKNGGWKSKGGSK